MRTGDRVDVVLDCVVEELDGRQYARVFVRLVDAPTSEGGAQPPAAHDGARRNVAQRWVGVADNQTFSAAFAIDLGPADSGDEPSVLAEEPQFRSHHKQPHGDGRPCEMGLWHEGPCPERS